MPPTAQASSAPIVVLVDAARLPMVKAYEKANPSVKIDLVTFDGGANGDGSIESKVALLQPGRPRVAGHRLLRARQTTSRSSALPPFNFPAVLNQGPRPKLASSRVTDRARWPPAWSAANLSACATTIAFDVLWVNVPLMKQWGYTRPHDLAAVAGDRRGRGQEPPRLHHRHASATPLTTSIYLQAAQCPVNDDDQPVHGGRQPERPSLHRDGRVARPAAGGRCALAAYVFASTFRSRTPARC